MLGISNSLFNYCNVTITLYAYILVCFLVSLAHKKCKLWYLVPYFLQVYQNYWGGGGGGLTGLQYVCHCLQSQWLLMFRSSVLSTYLPNPIPISLMLYYVINHSCLPNELEMFWSSGKWAHVVSTWYSLKWFQLSHILQHQHFIFTGTVLDVPFRPFVYLQCVIHCWYNFMNAWSSLWCPYHSLFSFVSLTLLHISWAISQAMFLPWPPFSWHIDPM